MNNDYLLPKLTSMLLQQEGIVSPDYKNLQLLSEKLLSQKNIHISANTLARLTGLKKETRNHYKHTIDNLAIATGFASFDHFDRMFSFKKQSYLSDTSWSGSDFIFSYTEKAAQKNDIDYFKSLNDFITIKGCPADMMLKIGFALTKGLRVNDQPQKLIPVLCDTPVYIDLLFETYVDIDHLSGYYGKAMLLLSEQAEMGSRTWLFSNTLAWHYSRLTNNAKVYSKKGQLLLEYCSVNLNSLLSDHCVYPYARWMCSALLYAAEKKLYDKVRLITEMLFADIDKQQADDAMVIISQMTDVAVFFNQQETQALMLRFENHAGAVRFERDSLMNASLNLSLLCKKWLMSPVQIRYELDNFPERFFSCKTTLEKKYLKATNEIM